MEAITCTACEGTGTVDVNCGHTATSKCAECAPLCELCDGDGILDFAQVKYWFAQAQQLTSRLRSETNARIDAEIRMHVAERRVLRILETETAELRKIMERAA